MFDPETFYDKQIEVAFGLHREDKKWRTQKLTLGELFAQHFQEFKRGPKDGRAITQGGLIGEQRKAKAVKSCSIVMLDHDTGETMDEVAAAIRARGLYATLWHTHSNGKPESEIPESKLVQFLRKDKDWLRDRAPSRDDSTLIDQCSDYLKKIKKLSQEILDSIEGVTKQHTDKGMMFIVQHAPMPRVRSLFVLDQPFVFAARGGTQDDAIDEWKDRYAGLSTALGLPFDPSCVDPSRLMYLPRMSVDADEQEFEIREIEGRLLTIEDMPRLSDLEKAAVDPLEAAAAALRKDTGGTGGDGRQAEWKTPGLRAFLAKHANDFEIEEFLEAHGLENRGPTTTGTCFECPTDGMHSDPGNPEDRGFWAQNASAREGGFACSCSHATCRAAAIEVTGKVDRAWFLDEFCAARGITVEELQDHCPNYQRDEDVRIEAVETTKDALVTRIEALGKPVNMTLLNEALALVAALPCDVERGVRLNEIKTRTGVGITTLRAGVARLIAEAAAQVAGGLAGEGGNAIGVRHPVPQDRATATIIYSTWGYTDQLECAKARFIAAHKKEPEIFAKKEGGVVRLDNSDPESLKFADVYTQPQWTHEIRKKMSFRNVTADEPNGVEVPPFPHVVGEFLGAVNIGLPIVDRIVNVPVFGPDGTLKIEEGYDEHSRTYLRPNMEYIPVPDEVTEDDVDLAVSFIQEAVRDFPFSDNFTGHDPEPIRIDGDVDDEGFPYPNLRRGEASRANFFALMLQPFARAMISGPCPAYLLDKSMPGTGAGFLADVAGYTLYGHRMTPQTVAEDKEEFRKEITATLREGATTIFLDNINHKMDHGPLASALTSGNWKGRILGQSTNVDVPVRATWIFAANSGRFSEELMRRIVPIRMDAQEANPSRDRPLSFYKHPDLHGWLEENRANLVWSCHVLVRNWVQAGRPDGSAMLQSFNSWARVMGGILEAARIEGFLKSTEDYLNNRVDEEDDCTEFFVRLMVHVKPGQEFDLDIAVLSAASIANPEKVDDSVGIFQKPGQDIRKAVGYFLRTLPGKTFLAGGKKLAVERSGKTKGNGRAFRLVLLN